MKRPATILAWALALFCIATATVFALKDLRAAGSTLWGNSVQTVLMGWALPVVFALTAAVIISRQPGNRVGWLLMLPALAVAGGAAATDFFAQPPPQLTPLLWLSLWANTWGWIVLIFPILLIPLHFPDGRPPTPRWRWVNWLALGMWLFFMLFVAFADTIGPLDQTWSLPNPVGFISTDIFIGPFGVIWSLGLVAITAGSVASLVVRYRRAGVVQREQIKWLLFAVLIFGLSYAVTAMLNTGQGEVSIVWLDMLMSLSMLFIPIAIAIAILRYRLFDIDVIIRKTALYGALTVLLGLIYFGTVFLLSALLRNVSGGESPLVLVISTLLIAALFMPLRRRLQAAIDRRFYRRKYDAQQILATFARTAREETDLDQLAGQLLAVLQETMEPQTINVWTAESRRTAPAATGQSES